MSGAVSPATRARESSIPVRIPPLAAGMMTVAIVFHLICAEGHCPFTQAIRNGAQKFFRAANGDGNHHHAQSDATGHH